MELCLAPFENHTRLQVPNRWRMDILDEFYFRWLENSLEPSKLKPLLGLIFLQNGQNQDIKSKWEIEIDQHLVIRFPRVYFFSFSSHLFDSIRNKPFFA